MMKLWLAWVCAMGVMLCAAASNVPVGYFMKNKAKLGEQVYYSFSYAHPYDEEVIFPDTSYSYLPFRLVNKTHFPTRTSNGVSKDSAVYQLAFFGKDSLCSFSLPVFVRYGDDSLWKWADRDTLLLQPIGGLHAGAPLMKNTAYIEVNPYFDLMRVAVRVLMVLGSAVVLWLVLRKFIIRRYQLLILNWWHMLFLRDFNRISATTADTESLKELLILWKSYLSRLTGMPILTLTTKEIIQLIDDSELSESLSYFDNIIYGSMEPERAQQHIQMLRKKAIRQYLNIKNRR